MKPKYFWLILVLISISWSLNTVYAMSQKLAEPIFLDHYITSTADDDFAIQFYYLANKDDTSDVYDVSINGVESYVNNPHFFLNEDLSQLNVQTFTHHALRRVEIVFEGESLADKLKEGPFSFKEMDVFFDSREKFTASIGEITIQSPIAGNEILTQVQGGGSNEYSWQFFKASEPLVIENISIQFEDALKKVVEHKVTAKGSPPASWADSWDGISGTTMENLELPIELEKVDQLRLYTKVKPSFKAFLEPQIIISGTTSTGIPFKSPGGFVQHPQLTQHDVKEIIKVKKRRTTDE